MVSASQPSFARPLSAPLFEASSAKLAWLSARQAVLAGNVANADTPHYRPRDLEKPDFAHLLRGEIGSTARIAPARTHARHMGGAAPRLDAEPVDIDDPWEIALAGNGVVLEEQARLISQTNSAHGMITAVRRKWIDMVRQALQGPQG